MVYKCGVEKIFDYFILAFLFLFFGSVFMPIANGLHNLGAYGSMAMIFIYMLVFWQKAKNNFLNNFLENRNIIILFILSLLVILIFSIFPYDDSFNSVKSAFKDNKKIWLLFPFLLFWYDGNIFKSKVVFLSFVVSLIVCVGYYVLRDILGSDVLGVEFRQREQRAGIIDRDYSHYFSALMIFTAVAILIFKNLYVRAFLLLFLVGGFFLNILTGARAGWGAVFLALLILFFYKKLFNKRILLLFVGLAIVILSSVLLIPKAQSLFLERLNAGLHTSHRDVILKTRLPLIFKSDRVIIGLGYGEYQYQKFLNDKNPEKLNLGPKGNKFADTQLDRYWHDEPAFVAYYWHYGIAGAIIILFTLYLFVFGFKRSKCNDYMLALSLSFFAYYGVHSLAEWFGEKELFIYALAFILLNYRNKICQK